jgi:SAM-dependent methyltransferase
MNRYFARFLRRLLPRRADPSSGIAFRAAGAVGTRNAQCRDQWIEGRLRAVPPGSRLLDAGAGPLRYKPLCSHLDYVSQDFAQYDGRGDGIALQSGQWNVSGIDIVSDITTIPLPDASFDVVLCAEVLEHIPAPVDALRELVRLLRPGGALLVTAPFCSLTHQSPFFFHTGYSRYFYEHWLHAFDCEILEIAFNGNFFEYLAQELRRLPDVAKSFADEELNATTVRAFGKLLTFLDVCSRKDTGSTRMLSFGLHVYARKLAANTQTGAQPDQTACFDRGD